MDEDSKIGSGHAAAMGRLGLSELRNAMAMSPDSNIMQQHSEYGLYGTATPGEVSDARRPEGYDNGQERGSVVEHHVEQAAVRAEVAREQPEMERG